MGHECDVCGSSWPTVVALGHHKLSQHDPDYAKVKHGVHHAGYYKSYPCPCSACKKKQEQEAESPHADAYEKYKQYKIKQHKAKHDGPHPPCSICGSTTEEHKVIAKNFQDTETYAYDEYGKKYPVNVKVGKPPAPELMPEWKIKAEDNDYFKLTPPPWLNLKPLVEHFKLAWLSIAEGFCPKCDRQGSTTKLATYLDVVGCSNCNCTWALDIDPGVVPLVSLAEANPVVTMPAPPVRLIRFNHGFAKLASTWDITVREDQSQ